MTSTYPSSFTQLRVLAEQARARGCPFEVFWDQAVRPRPSQPVVSWRTPEGRRPPDAVVWPSDTLQRNDDRVAAITQKEAWRRAYEGLPQLPGEAAVSRLGTALDGVLMRLDVELARGAGGGAAVPSAA